MRFQFYLTLALTLIVTETILILVQRYREKLMGEFLKIIFSLSFLYQMVMNAQLILLVIRYDGLVSWTYDQVFFISWILLTILTGIVLLQILSFISLIQKLFFNRGSQLSTKNKIIQFSIFLAFQISSICLLIFSMDLMLRAQRIFELQFSNKNLLQTILIKMIALLFSNSLFLILI